MLNSKGQISVNNTLQSTAFPEVFAVGVWRHAGEAAPRRCVTNHAVHAVSSAVNFVEGKWLKPFANPGSERLFNIVVAHGKVGYLIWDTDQLPFPVKYRCRAPCGGGFPSVRLLGNLRKLRRLRRRGGGSEGAAVHHNEVMLFKFAQNFGFKGMGAAPAQQAMK